MSGNVGYNLHEKIQMHHKFNAIHDKPLPEIGLLVITFILLRTHLGSVACKLCLNASLRTIVFFDGRPDW